jgi:hypothetical protein
MPSDSGRGRRPKAAALDLRTECYAEQFAELIGLVRALELLQDRIHRCAIASVSAGCGASQLGGVLGIHRATVYRRYFSEEDVPLPCDGSIPSGDSSSTAS